MRVFLMILLCVMSSGEDVKLLGLFSEYEPLVKSDLSDHTADDVQSRHCLGMFRAAISLANKYNILVDNKKISGSVIRTNSHENGYATFDLVCQYITSEHSNIVGIVGPATSADTRFIGPFAAHVKLPVISYAATNPDFSNAQHYPTFYRTVPSDRLLAGAIVQLFEKFNWTTLTIIYQADEYGYGGLRILSESYHEKITIKAQLAFNGHNFNADLKQTLEKSQSRIVLIWASQNETTKIVKQALQQGLVGAPYVWITTNEVALSVFLSNMSKHEEYCNKLEGLLTIIPVEGDSRSYHQNSLRINETLFNEALAAWSNSSVKEDRDEYLRREKHNISPFALFTFDATWALIQALNKTSFNNQSGSPSFVPSSSCFNSSLKNDQAYHQYLKATNFSGISGQVIFSSNLSNDRTDGAYYVSKNVQCKRQRPLIYEEVMIWQEKPKVGDENWQNVPGEFIVWPNSSKETPTHHPQIRGQKLGIRVIESPPFVTFWNKSSTVPRPVIAGLLDTEDQDIKIYGYVADFITKLQEKMQFKLKIDAVSPNTSYNTLVESVSWNDSWNIAISDITITSNRLLNVDFSLPIYENSVRIVVRENSPFSVRFLSFLRPFSLQVWLSIIGLIFYSGLLVYIFERKQVAETNPQPVFRTIFIGVYHTLSCVIGIGAYVELKTASSRIMVMALFALSIILVATYTANLSSFLTLQRAKSIISGIDDIKNGRLPFQRIGIVNNSAIVDYYTQNVSTIFYSLQSTKAIYTSLLENRIDAALWDATALEYIVDQHYCHRLSVVGVGFAKSSFGIAMRKNWQYKADLDRSILSLRESAVLESLEQKWFSQRICNDDVQKTWEDDGIPIAIMSGLFYTFFMVSAVALILHLWSCRIEIVSHVKPKADSIAQFVKVRFLRKSVLSTSL